MQVTLSSIMMYYGNIDYLLGFNPTLVTIVTKQTYPATMDVAILIIMEDVQCQKHLPYRSLPVQLPHYL